MDNFLEFERPIEELSAKIDELERVSQTQNIDLGNEISKLETRRQKVTQDIFSSLDPWQVTQLARHPMRPYTLDYVGLTLMGSKNYTVTVCLPMIDRLLRALENLTNGTLH